MITRKIKHELVECAAEYPAVTILGPRQSGKTTLAKMVFSKHPHISLEDPDIRRQATDDPRGLLDALREGAILDEIQRVPQLLSYLQGVIDANRKPGRFILIGSHQPLVHEAISQSLAGRTAVLKLLPFTVEEVRRYKEHPQSPFEWIHEGFYPGLHENKLQPVRFFRSYVATYIDQVHILLGRKSRLVLPVISVRQGIGLRRSGVYHAGRCRCRASGSPERYVGYPDAPGNSRGKAR